MPYLLKNFQSQKKITHINNAEQQCQSGIVNFKISELLQG